MLSPRTLITGAASGIGRALASRLSARGHPLVLVDQHPMDDVCPGADNITRLDGDVSSERFWDHSEPLLEGIRGAAINAGISSAGYIRDIDFGEWKRVLAVNLDGAFLGLRAALRAMQPGSGDRCVVLTSSITAIKAEAGTAAYGASKSAVLQLMKVAAKEVAAEGIRVNAIAPGGVDTAIWDSMPFFQAMVSETGSREKAMARMAETATPLGRFATADEIAAQIDFLLSEAAANITGGILTSDGGYSL